MTSTICWRQPVVTKWIESNALEWFATGDCDFKFVPSYILVSMQILPREHKNPLYKVQGAPAASISRHWFVLLIHMLTGCFCSTMTGW